MLHRRLGLLQAVSLNMSMMVGVGPFIAIPLLLGKMGGPQAMLGWVIGAAVAVADGWIWSELAAAFPGSGGTYHFFDSVFGATRLGRSLKFLFIWQFLFSGPLELASGMLGFADYAAFLWPPLDRVVWRVDGLSWVVRGKNLLAVAATLALVGLAYRRIEAAGRLMIVLWVGMLVAVAWVIVEGFAHANLRLALDFPPDAWRLDGRFALGLGGALGLAMYSYLGYYQICYLGDEVIEPARTIPRSITISVTTVAVIYFTMTLGILGVIPWREAVGSSHVASDLIARLDGPIWANAMSSLVMWSAVAACFAALLGYSRIPYAAANSGHFFRGLAHLHPVGDFPDRSLLAIGGLAAIACLAELGAVIDALLSSRILIQFVVQALMAVHIRSRPELLARLPFRMKLYPIPVVVALVGWLWVFGTTSLTSIAYGLGSLGLGVVVFLIWDRGVGKLDRRSS